MRPPRRRRADERGSSTILSDDFRGSRDGALKVALLRDPHHGRSSDGGSLRQAGGICRLFEGDYRIEHLTPRFVTKCQDERKRSWG